MKKYRANNFGIEKYEILKETEKQVVFLNSNNRETREAKISDWCSWHDTHEEAVNYLILKQNNQIAIYNYRIKYCNHEIEKIKNFPKL